MSLLEACHGGTPVPATRVASPPWQAPGSRPHGLWAPVGCACFFELLGAVACFASILWPALWVSGGQRPRAEADQEPPGFQGAQQGGV